MARRRRLHAWNRAGGAAVLLTGLYFVMPLDPWSPDAPFVLRVAVLAALLALLTWLANRQVRRALAPDRILAEQITMLLTLVNVVIVAFAAVYYMLHEQFTGLVTRMDALYFTVVTLCTVGFGDISPVGQGVRALVTLQMVFDLVIVTSAISLVVTGLRTREARA